MSLFKPKLNNLLSVSAGNFVIIALFLANFLGPLSWAKANDSKLANTSQNSSLTIPVITEAPDSRMFVPPSLEIEKPHKRIKAVITGYSSTVDQTDASPFIAASGARVYDGMIANNCLPFGTKIKIPGLYGEKLFTVADRMNSRYGCSRFDIWFDAPKKEVRQFGVKRTEIEVFYVKKKSKELAKAK